MQTDSEQFEINRVRFLGEQDGKPEREFKLKLKELFSRHIRIQEAFLMRVAYNELTEWNVALCLVGLPDQTSLVEIQNLFWQMFRTKEHLDVLVLNPAQHEQVKNVAKPFFTASIPEVRQ